MTEEERKDAAARSMSKYELITYLLSRDDIEIHAPICVEYTDG